MKTKLNKVFASCILISSVMYSQAQDKRNYISPTDPDLKITEKFNNPMRNMWSAGMNVGVDVSTFSGGVFGELTGYFTPKRLSVKASYAFDLSKSDLFTKSNLYASANKYGNLQLTGIFNFKDNISEYTASPTIGFEKLSESSTKITGYFYKTDFTVKHRKTMGIGGSFTNFSSNVFYDTEKVDTTKSFITLENNAAIPSKFIMPFSSSIVGLSFQLGDFTSTKVIYQYKNLRATKFKINYYKIINFELLFAPSVRNSESVFYESSANTISSIRVEDVKKKRLGFRITATTNQFKKLQGKPGFYMNGEVGMRPGIYPNKLAKEGTSKFGNALLSQPWYMKFGVGFAF